MPSHHCFDFMYGTPSLCARLSSVKLAEMMVFPAKAQPMPSPMEYMLLIDSVKIIYYIRNLQLQFALNQSVLWQGLPSQRRRRLLNGCRWRRVFSQLDDNIHPCEKRKWWKQTCASVRACVYSRPNSTQNSCDTPPVLLVQWCKGAKQTGVPVCFFHRRDLGI